MSWAFLFLLIAEGIPLSWERTLLYKDVKVMGLISSAWFVEGKHKLTDLPVVKANQCVIQSATDTKQSFCIAESMLVSWEQMEGGAVLSISRKSSDWAEHLQGYDVLLQADESSAVTISVRSTSIEELHADLLSQGFHNNWRLLLNDKSSSFMLLSWKQEDGANFTQSAHPYSNKHLILSELRSSQ